MKSANRNFRMLLIIVICLLGVGAHAESLEEFLQAFHKNPKQMMRQLPSAVTESGEVISRGSISYDQVQNILKEKNKFRNEIMSRSQTVFSDIMAEPDEKNRPERLIDPGPVLINLAVMEQRKLFSRQVPRIPWADSYWPLYKGMIGIRYADPDFPQDRNWLVNYHYILDRSVSAIAASGNQKMIDQLSPAEKYDLAVGDWNFTLTNFVWSEGQKHFDDRGVVAKWMGICHGWAAASHMQASIPSKPVTVTSPHGLQITFYPGDVRALQSLLWARGSVDTRFVGDRCNTSNPAEDRNGRIVDQKCFDTNPGTWHIAAINQMGINQRSFVMDATFDFEVWNYPLSAYSYTYFNPQDLRQTQTLRAALVPIQRFTMDKFRRYRSEKARYVAGIVMNISHIKAINPRRGVLAEDPVNTLRFVYDLELDEDLNIVGGEWYTNAHPDFIWTFDRNAQAMAVGDSLLINDNWRLGEPVPSYWSQKAAIASARGSPLYSFIQRLTSRY